MGIYSRFFPVRILTAFSFGAACSAITYALFWLTCLAIAILVYPEPVHILWPAIIVHTIAGGLGGFVAGANFAQSLNRHHEAIVNLTCLAGWWLWDRWWLPDEILLRFTACLSFLVSWVLIMALVRIAVAKRLHRSWQEFKDPALHFPGVVMHENEPMVFQVVLRDGSMVEAFVRPYSMDRENWKWFELTTDLEIPNYLVKFWRPIPTSK